MSKTLLLDAGHGGLNAKGVYTTPASDGKFWKHNRGTFHKGSIFYEGVSNRVFADKVESECVKRGIRVVKIYHPTLCTTLKGRTDFANLYNTFNPGGSVCLSLHSNAINKQDGASGFCLYTSPGRTNSDVIAEAIWNGVNDNLAGKYSIKMRSDTSDGDHDYEARFAMLVDTAMPSILIENLFFDHYGDATLLMNPKYQDDFATTVVDSLVPFLQ